MLSSILLLTDFSDAAFHAAEYACQLSEKLGVRQLYLMHSYQTVNAPVNVPTSQATDSDQETVIVDVMEVWQESLRQFVHSSTQIVGATAEADLLEAVRHMQELGRADLVVMGMSDKSAFERLLGDSSTLRVLKNLDCPLLIVPEKAAINTPKKILLATNLQGLETDLSLTALEAILNGLDAQLQIVYADADGAMLVDEMREWRYLEKLLEQHEPAFHFLHSIPTVSALRSFAEAQSVDLVVTLHEQRSFLSELFHQSLSKEMAWNTTMPLLVLPV